MNFYKCDDPDFNEGGIVYVLAESHGKAKSLALNHFISEGWEMEYTQVSARKVRNPLLIVWLMTYVGNKAMPQIVENPAMFCQKCESENGLYFLKNENGDHVCEPFEEDV